jgi:hypothetical protein
LDPAFAPGKITGPMLPQVLEQEFPSSFMHIQDVIFAVHELIEQVPEPPSQAAGPQEK